MSKSYVTTREGLEKMKRELAELKSERRPEIADRIARAKELGDLSENAEYHDAKDALAFLEGRVLELEDFIAHAVVSEPVSTETATVGCKVTCESNGKTREFWLVGSREADPSKGKISNESPLGAALMGKRKGDVFEMKVPAGTVTYTVVSITCE